MINWIIHIGAPKTGSTAIQRFLFDNRKALTAYGVHYPDVSLRGYGHHDLAFLLGGGYPVWATPQNRTLAELGALLRDDVKATDAGTVLLSSENFYIVPRPAELRRLLRSAGMAADDRVTVLCYLRRQDEAHISWYNQTVKAQGNTAGFEASVRRDHGLWDYALRLKPWQDEFGTAAIRLRDYTALASGDVLVDFLQAIGLPPAAFDLPPSRPNGRINRDILDFQRLINRLPLPVARKRRYHRQLIALTEATSGRPIFDDTPFLSLTRRAALVDAYAAANARVARDFLGRDDLFAPVAGTDGPSVRRGLTPAKLLFIARWLIAHRAS